MPQNKKSLDNKSSVADKSHQKQEHHQEDHKDQANHKVEDQKDSKHHEDGSHEKQHKKQQKQEKQLRRIAQRAQMPTDKTQLIQYLSQRIKQAQDALNDTQDLLQEQVKEREKISKSLDQRNQQLSKLYQIDQRGLPEKIKQKLNEILTLTVTQKMESQQKLQEQKRQNYQYKCRLAELQWIQKIQNTKLQQQQKKENQLTEQLQALNQLNKGHEAQLQSLQSQYAKVREHKQSLQNKYFQMKVALDRMGDIKGVLNRFFGNQDLFDEKMELKEQKVQRLPLPAKDTPLPPPSRDSKAGKGANNSAKLKPLAKQKNDDEDFWKGDFKGKNSVY